jgi:hypothetical protein
MHDLLGSASDTRLVRGAKPGMLPGFGGPERPAHKILCFVEARTHYRKLGCARSSCERIGFATTTASCVLSLTLHSGATERNRKDACDPSRYENPGRGL